MDYMNRILHALVEKNICIVFESLHVFHIFKCFQIKKNMDLHLTLDTSLIINTLQHECWAALRLIETLAVKFKATVLFKYAPNFHICSESTHNVSGGEWTTANFRVTVLCATHTDLQFMAGTWKAFDFHGDVASTCRFMLLWEVCGAKELIVAFSLTAKIKTLNHRWECLTLGKTWKIHELSSPCWTLGIFLAIQCPRKVRWKKVLMSLFFFPLQFKFWHVNKTIKYFKWSKSPQKLWGRLWDQHAWAALHYKVYGNLENLTDWHPSVIVDFHWLSEHSSPIKSFQEHVSLRWGC